MLEKKNSSQTDNYLQMLNANYLKKFSKNYLNKLKIYLDDEIYKSKSSDLPQLKSLTILKFEKMIKKENMMKENKKFKELNKIGSNNLDSETNLMKINFNRKVRKTQSNVNSEAKNKKLQRNKMMDMHNMDDDFTKSDLYDPYKTYLQEDNEKLRKQALDKIISNAMTSAYSVKTNSISKRLKNQKETTSNNSKSNMNSVLTQSHLYDTNIMNMNINTNNNNNLTIFSKDKQAIDMYSSHFPKIKSNQLTQSIFNQSSRDDEHQNYENFMTFFKEACEINNYITIDQKIDYFMQLKNNIFINKSNSERRNLIPITNTSRKKGLILSDRDQENSSNPNEKEQEFHTFYEHRDDEIRNSIAPTHEDELPIRRNDIHKATISFNIHHKYITDLKNKFKLPDEINYKTQVELENFYTDLLSKIKLSKQPVNNVVPNINNKDSYNNSNLSPFEKIKTFLNVKELSLDKVSLRECEITLERFVYMIGKKAFNFRILENINFSRNLLGDTGASYLLYLIKMNSIRLEYLDLSYNKLGKNSCEFLAEILSDDKIEIISLNINGNSIGDKYFSEISVGISKNSYLKRLCLSGNDLGKISSVILGTILRYDKKLKFLDVSKNFFNDEVIKNLLRGLISNSCLECLILNENNLTNSSLKNFETTLSVNYTLKKIFLERNLFSNCSSSKFLSILYKNSYIEYISLIGNKLDMEFEDALIENEKKMPVKIINKSDYLAMLIKNEDSINFHQFY